MGEVVNLNVVRRVPIESQTLISFALLREIRNRIDGLASGAGFVHLRDADTGTAISVYVQDGHAVRWVANGPCTESEAFQQACRFEGEMRRQIKPYR